METVGVGGVGGVGVGGLLVLVFFSPWLILVCERPLNITLFSS